MHLRFEDSANGTVGGRHFDVIDDAGTAKFAFDTTGNQLGGTVTVSGEDGAPVFDLVPRGRLMNMTYFVDEAGSGRRLATLTRKGLGFLWRATDGDERELARVVDPASLGEKIVRELFFGADPDGYVVIRGDAPVASIIRMRRPDPDDDPGFLRRHIRRLLPLSDWAIRLDDTAADVDLRLLVALFPPLYYHHIIAGAASN